MQRFRESNDTSSNASLYDSGDVRKVLVRAAEIEERQQNDLLDANQVEALGEEIGLSPDAVRRALGETHRASQDVAVSSQTRQSSRTPGTLRSAYLPNLWLGLLWIPTAFIESRAVDSGAMSGETMIQLALYTYLPALFLLAVRSGFVTKRPGIGIGGAWLATLSTLAISCVSGYMGSLDHSTPLASMLMTNLVFSLIGAFGGALGVGARYAWDNLPHNATRPHNADR